MILGVFIFLFPFPFSSAVRCSDWGCAAALSAAQVAYAALDAFAGLAVFEALETTRDARPPSRSRGKDGGGGADDDVCGDDDAGDTGDGEDVCDAAAAQNDATATDEKVSLSPPAGDDALLSRPWHESGAESGAELPPRPRPCVAASAAVSAAAVGLVRCVGDEGDEDPASTSGSGSGRSRLRGRAAAGGGGKPKESYFVAKTRSHYDGCKMFAPGGQHLCNINARRADWQVRFVCAALSNAHGCFDEGGTAVCCVLAPRMR